MRCNPTASGCEGPQVFLYDDYIIMFHCGRASDFYSTPGVTFNSQDVKTFKYYKTGNSPTIDVNGNTCHETVAGQPDMTGMEMYFGGHFAVSDLFNINIDLTNIKFTTTCRSDFPTPTGSGDPHFVSWSGMKYDFHGVCDLVLLQNKGFQEGLGIDIHVRTKKINKFSYISSAVLRVGDQTLEVMGDNHKALYWINKQPIGNYNENNEMVGVINGYPISYREANSKKHEFIVTLGDDTIITMSTFKKFVHVGIQGASKEKFGTSRGLLGGFHGGKLLGRNNKVMVDKNEFGLEWQVIPSDGILFHNVEGPQAPEKCVLPAESNLRRRLAESTVGEEEAQVACANADPDVYEMCVIDVMATGDKEVVGAY